MEDDSWSQRNQVLWVTLIAFGLLAMVVAAVVVRAQSDKEPSATGGQGVAQGPRKPPVCLTGAWPAEFDGPSAAMDSGALGVFVWRGPNGWSVRVREPGGPESSVVVTATQSLLPSQFTLAPPGTGTLNVAGRKATYTAGSDNVDGFDFKGCFIKEMRIEVYRAGVLVSPAEIKIGSETTALTNPVIVARTP